MKTTDKASPPIQFSHEKSAELASARDCPGRPTWVTYGLSAAPSCESAPGGTAEEIRAKTDVAAQMSVVGGTAAVDGAVPELRLVAEGVEKLPKLELF